MPIMRKILVLLLLLLAADAPASWLTFWKTSDEDTDPDRRLLATVFKPYGAQMPEGLLTPGVRRSIGKELDGTREKTPLFAIPHHKPSPEARRWIIIPRQQWRDIISPYAPLTVTRCGGPCPFCGKPLPGIRCDIVVDPNRGITLCCGATVYERESDMPGEYPVRPNRALKLPHPNGRIHTYRFHSPNDSRVPTNTWFCAEGELWWARMNKIVYEVVPDLAHAVYFDNDPIAAKTLAIVYARLTDVYPSLPFIDVGRPFGFARINDMAPELKARTILTAKYWQVERSRREYTDCRFSEWDTDHCRIPHAGACGSDGNLVPLGILAEGFEIVHRHPSFRAVSKEFHGKEDKFEQVMRQRLFRQACTVFRHKRPSRPDTIGIWIGNSIKLAVAARDFDYLHKIAQVCGSTYHNRFYPDGMAIEGAFDYAAESGWFFRQGWVSRELLGCDFAGRVPFAARIGALGRYPIVTQMNAESRHGQQRTRLFGSANLPPSARTRGDSQRSQSFPFGGLTCLRAGRADNRIEAILDYQNVATHSHAGRMNLQLFYKGLNILPDLGCDAPDGNGPGGLSAALEAHCTGAVNGTQLDRWGLSLLRYHGGHAPGTPGAVAQFVEVEGRHSFDHVAQLANMQTFNRQLVALQLPGGRPCVLDVFRMSGGQRHDMFWHVPAPPPTNSLGAPTPLPTESLYQWYVENATPPPGWLKETEFLFAHYRDVLGAPYREELRQFTSPVTWSPDTNVWTSTWRIDPDRYTPATEQEKETYQPWREHLQPAGLRIWGHVSGGAASRYALLGARMPWNAQSDGDMDVLAVHRQGSAGKPLHSSFTHILEPFTPEEGPALRNVEPIETSGHSTGNAGAWELRCVDGEPVFVGTALAHGTFTSPQFAFAGRMAMVAPRVGDMVLFDGTHARAEHFAVTLETGYRAVLTNAVGDISGHPTQSALIVRSGRALPPGKRLAGQTLVVRHRTGGAHISTFEIEAITPEGGAGYRIDLRHNPPLIHNKLYVTRYTPDRPRRVTCDARLLDGVARPTGLGRRARFPRSGFETAVAGMTAWGPAGSWSRTLYLEDEPPPEQVREGDPMILFTVQSGDEVIIPSMFACTTRRAGDTQIMTLLSTGEATVQFSTNRKIRKLSGSVSTSHSADATAITIPAGKHHVMLEAEE